MNIIEGADDAQNSIGKTTFMQIIDFVYGGSQFQESDVVRLGGAVGHHTIYFTLHLHGTDHHYSRSTERYGYVTTYADPDWKIETGSLCHWSSIHSSSLLAMGWNTPIQPGETSSPAWPV
ncbi:hypothetical protein [Corynebacterium pelargi]|uniref:Uncharacterized protein n=1 Tax=Corynebacterium pelargi TaxID=1471400 RepID=A0A410W795_9CORY|nr:hypothetical protein [Corynebacterium pelargi]QAU51823.1 hypothetical protein CPELA_02690 [Corynebacterium pelargi]GGG72229.1 hypothetical protein GCM10007338_06620 [Corynebacterium pelargi]